MAITETVECNVRIKVKCPKCPECGGPMNYKEHVTKTVTVPTKIFGFINSTKGELKTLHRYECMVCKHEEEMEHDWDYHKFEYHFDLDEFEKLDSDEEIEEETTDKTSEEEDKKNV